MEAKVHMIPRRSELVLAFVGPVGVETSRFHDAARVRLSAFGYEPEFISLSKRLDDLQASGLLKTAIKSTPEYERISSHMEAGDELRGLRMDGARGLLAAAAISFIAGKRQRNEKNQPMPWANRAWLISSLKNPAEVEFLRRVYGPGFFLVGLFATESERKKALERGMSPEHAADLIKRDAESANKHGQQTRKTFELADVWVTDEDQLCRFLDLIFGDTFQNPTDDEDGMALAYVAALRSSDLSRQVGAAIVSRTGEVLGVGRNEAPAPGGGQYSPTTEAKPSARDSDVGTDSNVKERLRIQDEITDEIGRQLSARIAEVESTLGEEGREAIRAKLGDLRVLMSESLQRTALRDITEYGRAVHAEMSALLSAVRVGTSVRGATLYCTTFPCHNCAKHIAAAGISRVVFVEPYPKSKAEELHADAITLVGETEEHDLARFTAKRAADRTRFEPFVGVGPRRYFDLFSMNLGTGRAMVRKSEFGDARKFDPGTASPRVPLATTTYLEEEIEASGVLEDAKQKMRLAE